MTVVSAYTTSLSGLLVLLSVMSPDCNSEQYGFKVCVLEQRSGFHRLWRRGWHVKSAQTWDLHRWEPGATSIFI